MAQTVGELFDREPQQWETDGDRSLWRWSRDRFAGVPIPESRGALDALLRTGVAEELGVPLTSPHDDVVALWRSGDGRPTSEVVDILWWRRQALPLLLDRADLPGATVALRTTTEEDWRSIRRLRIENATENPISYGATLETTLGMTEDEWRLRGRRGSSRSATSLVAVDDRSGRWVGMMSAQEDADPPGCLLTGVYVAPAYRGRRQGVADALFGEILGWTTRRSGPLRLWVDAGDAGLPARGFYARHGFAATGRAKPIGFVAGNVVEMARLVSASAPASASASASVPFA